MCVECGCGETGHGIGGERRRGVVLPHHHHEEGGHEGPGPGASQNIPENPGVQRTIRLEQDILGKNNRIARDNRDFFREHGIFVLNLLSAPGSGKTTLLERTINALGTSCPMAVIEGDQETCRDADRIRELGVQAVQINTGAGCHLDAHQVAHAAGDLELFPGTVLAIENIGNLVCPALFDLGETARVVLFSVTEGEDKPLKYPRIFREADLTLLTKSDLLPHLDFDRTRAESSLRGVNPRGEIIALSSRTGEGFGLWLSWLMAHRDKAGASPHVRA